MNKIKIIIVGEVQQAEDWCLYFTNRGYDCTVSNTAREATYLLHANSYDLAIIDISLPDSDGFEFKQQLNNQNVRVPVIFVTDLPIIDGIAKTRELGAITFLRKPITNKDLEGYVVRGVAFNRTIKKKSDYLTPIARLEIKQPNTIDVELLLSRSYTIGRYRAGDVPADIRLTNSRASRKHAILLRIYEGDKSWYRIVDYSSNGIAVNGKKVKGYQDLRSGDLLQFPACTMLYTLIDREATELDLRDTYTGENEESNQ